MKWREKHEGFKGQRIVVVPRPVLATALQDPLLRNLAATDAGYYPKARGHTCARETGCPEAIFIYCAEGDGWCEMAGRRHEVTKDQLLVVTASTPHVYGAAKKTPWTIHWFHAVGANFSLFEEVVEALEHGCTLRNLVYAAHSLTHLMGVILRHKEEHGYGAPSVREQIARSVEFMKGHLSEPLKVATLAALVNLSRSHYTTLFRRVTGYAPISYLNHLRMQHAVQLLNSTDLPIKQISDQLGFSDQFYFSRAFSRMHNHSPTEHRQRYSAKAFSESRQGG